MESIIRFYQTIYSIWQFLFVDQNEKKLLLLGIYQKWTSVFFFFVINILAQDVLVYLGE